MSLTPTRVSTITFYFPKSLKIYLDKKSILFRNTQVKSLNKKLALERSEIVKKIFWLVVLILLIPLWAILYLIGMLGLASSFLWDNFYHSIYRLAGSPLDKK